MKRIQFERPTEYYDEQLLPIDEQICALLQQRKKISNHNPGYPPFEYIERWANLYGLYEDYLKSVFGTLRSEELYKPQIEPNGFRMHIPVLKSIENDGYLYTVTSVRQYENASVITLTADWDVTIDSSTNLHNRRHFDLQIEGDYDCRMDRWEGNSGDSSYHFVVSPPLPDEISGMEFRFVEYRRPFKEQPTGYEIRMIP
ncbi:hypothetical protein ACTID9_14330 [Brevibacillus fluminis]|uniref:hypothetical protein n=1 Tax=Brevibacillus fluminis TaxID=511487 RepID=UPI003F8BF992